MTSPVASPLAARPAARWLVGGLALAVAGVALGGILLSVRFEQVVGSVLSMAVVLGGLAIGVAAGSRLARGLFALTASAMTVGGAALCVHPRGVATLGPLLPWGYASTAATACGLLLVFGLPAARAAFTQRVAVATARAAGRRQPVSLGDWRADA